jgi:hypothetical protein
MHGHFEGGVLCNHTFCWTFTPGHKGDSGIVVPVYDGGRLIDFVGWLANDCDGILALSKSFLPQLRNAPKLIAVLMYRVFIDPATKFGCDEAEAEAHVYEQIEVVA